MQPVKDAVKTLLALAVLLLAENEVCAQIAVPTVVTPVSTVANITGLGTAIDGSKLDQYRGGSDVVVNNLNVNGAVKDNIAANVITGTNSITDGAFSNASGLPIVIQNSGANVLIQTATIVNVQFK